MSIPMGLSNLIANLKPAKVLQWAESSENGGMDERVDAPLSEANVISSKRTDQHGLERHALLIDLDVPAYLIPSSTEGHSHLYVDVSMNKAAYFRVLDALADAGIIERGYSDVSQRKGATFLRLPWVKKPAPAPDPWADF